MYCLTISDVKYNFRKGLKLIDIIRQNTISFPSPCGGIGTCGKCKILFKSGDANQVTSEEKNFLTAEELHEGIRLACFVEPKGDICIELLSQKEDGNSILTEGALPDFELQPTITKRKFAFQQPSFKTELSYLELLEKILEQNLNSNTYQILKGIPPMVNEKDFTAIYAESDVLGIETGDTTSQLYGVAVDIGTTTVVASLINLNDGEEIATQSAINPQSDYGLDVLSRIEFIKKNTDGLELLHNAIIKCINIMIEAMCKHSKVDKATIYEVAVSANTIMLHTLLNIDPVCMGKAPYLSIFRKQQRVLASQLNLNISPYGMVHTLPGVSSFVGSDIVSGVSASEITKKNNKVLFIDIGTNGEMVLWNSGKMVACACAAGPALEGMNIKSGMRATNGAVEDVQIVDDRVLLRVIGDTKPIGICGSGIIDCISVLLKEGIIAPTGRINKEDSMDHLPKGMEIITGDTRSVVLSSKGGKVSVTQKDVRQVQLAKGAILSGIYTLLEYMSLDIHSLDEVVIAGQFGKHLKVESLIGVGILPAGCENKIRYVGNSSKTGAILYLLSKNFRKVLNDTSNEMDYFELSTVKDYEKTFTKALSFKKI